MTPEQHELFHQKDAARALSKTYRILASNLSRLEMALNFRHKAKTNIFSASIRASTEVERPTEEESTEVHFFLQHFQYASRRLIDQLPDDWLIKEPKVWRSPPCESAARNMAAQFMDAARYIDSTLKTKQRFPGEDLGWRILDRLKLLAH